MKSLWHCPRIGLVLLLAAIGLEGRAAESTPNGSNRIDGTWRWNFTMPDGTTSRPKLTLATEDGKLTGKTRFRPGNDAAITNATLKGDELSFQVMRERDGRPILTTYTGKWSGKVIKGKVESNWAGDNQSYDWEAVRAHEGVSGTWKWTNSFRGRRFEMRVELEQEGEALTGSMPGFGRGRRRIEIKNGSVKDGTIYFETERGTGEDKVITKYSARQTGDLLKGSIETTLDGEEVKSDWEARRTD